MLLAVHAPFCLYGRSGQAASIGLSRLALLGSRLRHGSGGTAAVLDRPERKGAADVGNISDQSVLLTRGPAGLPG